MMKKLSSSWLKLSTLLLMSVNLIVNLSSLAIWFGYSTQKSKSEPFLNVIYDPDITLTGTTAKLCIAEPCVTVFDNMMLPGRAQEF